MPPVFVINLDSSPDRMAMMAQRLTEAGIPFRRVPGVLGRDLPEWESWVDLERYPALNRAPKPKPGEVGCYLSHLRALETFLASGEPWGVILEDDAEPLPGLKQTLDDLGEAGDWDVVKLFCFHSGTPVGKRRLSQGRRLAVHLTRTTSNAAYAVNRHAAEVLLRHLRPMREQVDHAIDRPWETGLRIRSVRPLPMRLMATSKRSTIGKMAHPWKLDPVRGLRLFINRTWKEIRRFFHAVGDVIRS